MKTPHLLTTFATLTLLLAINRVAAEGIPEAARATLDQYVAIQKSLADDSMKHVAHNASAIAKAAAEHTVQGLPHAVAKEADAVAMAKDIKAAREAFKALSKSFEAYLKDHAGKPGEYRVAYCPMAKAGWVQTGDTIANPYYGKAMLKCGKFTR